MKRAKSILSIIMVMMLLTVGLFGCNSINPNDVKFDEYETYDEFRFYAYYTPPGATSDNPISYQTDECYKDIADCGFNYAIAVSEATLEQKVNLLEGLAPYGVNVVLGDSQIGNLIALYEMGCADDDERIINGKQRFEENYAVYSKYDNFVGIFAKDEPQTSLNPYIGKVNEYYKTVTDKEWYVNLLPTCSNSQLGNDGGYSAYVEDAAKTQGSTHLNFDCYPLSTDGILNSYYSTISKVSNTAKKYDKDFIAFILTLEHMTYISPDNYDDIAWQVYSLMLFGCKGIETFTYWPTVKDGYGLTDMYGNKSPVYYAMKEVISEVKSFQSMYMNSTHTGTMFYVADEDYPNKLFAMTENPLERHDRIKNLSGDGDFAVGTYVDKDDRDAFLIMNSADPAKDKTINVSVEFDDANYAVCYKKGRKVYYKLDNGKLDLTIGSGEGFYVIPIKL